VAGALCELRSRQSARRRHREHDFTIACAPGDPPFSVVRIIRQAACQLIVGPWRRRTAFFPSSRTACSRWCGRGYWPIRLKARAARRVPTCEFPMPRIAGRAACSTARMMRAGTSIQRERTGWRTGYIDPGTGPPRPVSLLRGLARRAGRRGSPRRHQPYL